MTDDKQDKLAKGLRRELTEAEALERDLDRLFESLQPPYGAQDRLMARLEGDTFSERDLVLDGGAEQADTGPYSFEQALAQQQAADDETACGGDLLAAGLEEEPVEEDENNPQPGPDDASKQL